VAASFSWLGELTSNTKGCALSSVDRKTGRPERAAPFFLFPPIYLKVFCSARIIGRACNSFSEDLGSS
jgi:hypothetical protein